MILKPRDCKYSLKCESYEAKDPLCIYGNAPHKFLRKPDCYFPKKRSILYRTFHPELSEELEFKK